MAGRVAAIDDQLEIDVRELCLGTRLQGGRDAASGGASASARRKLP